MNYVKVFEKLGKEDIPIAGGKGANLGELTNAGIPVPPGFVITSETYNKFITKTGIINQINDMLNGLDINDTLELQKVADDIKNLIITTDIPDDIQRVIIEAYNALCLKVDLDEVVVAIRSSATAEDLPDASFAGQQETYLNISGIDDVLENVRLAPSALNKQPWRIVKQGENFHFFISNDKEEEKNLYNIKNIDIGIAMCHFDLTCKEKGIKGKFKIVNKK